MARREDVMSHQPVSQKGGSREQQRASARAALLSYAFFRWESAVTLAMTLILVVFLPDPFRGAVPFWGWWMWIGLGLLAEALIVGTTLTDRDVRARVVSQLIRDRFDLGAISDHDLRQRVVKALDIREHMEVVFQRSHGRASGASVGSASLSALVDEVSGWIEGMYRLARRLDEAHDQAALLTEDQALQERIDQADGRVVAQLDDSLGALEAIYTQVQLVAARGADDRRVRQLRQEIGAHAQSLSELEREVAESFEQIAERLGS
jgi:hypothetical protein